MEWRHVHLRAHLTDRHRPRPDLGSPATLEIATLSTAPGVHLDMLGARDALLARATSDSWEHALWRAGVECGVMPDDWTTVDAIVRLTDNDDLERMLRKAGLVSVDHVYAVRLRESGRRKIDVIIALRARLPLGLRAAKDMIDRPPLVVRTFEDVLEAEALRDELNAAGGSAEVLRRL